MVLPNTVVKAMRTNFNLTFLTTAEGVERILIAVFEFIFSKMT